MEVSMITPRWLAARLQGLAAAQLDEPGFARYFHPPGREVVAAAVLVPLVNRVGGMTVLLTQRTRHLTDHAGQISFPGGRVEHSDADRAATALREAEEETGLLPSRVTVVGQLPDYDIHTGFRVTPVVGWVEPPLELAPDPFEVEEVFEVPLDLVLGAENYERHSDDVGGRRRNYYALPYGGRRIWGATAGMLFTLHRALEAGRSELWAQPSLP